MTLAWLIAFPLLGGLFCYQTQERSALGAARLVALVSLLQSLRVMVGEPQRFGLPWLTSLGIDFDLALHPAGLPMLVLGPLLTLCALLMVRSSCPRPQELSGHLLLLLASLQGLFLADNLGLFYIFFEVMLLPSLLLTSRWGGEQGRSSALKFFLYTLVGSLPMLLGVLALSAQGGLSFAQLRGLPVDVQMNYFWLFALAFLVKLPIFPLHGWQIDLYRSAPAPVVAVVAGVMSKAGAYGLIRVLLGVFPAASEHYAPLLAGLALVSLLHGAVCALGAPCLRSIFAYSSLSHLSLVALAILAGGNIGQVGATLQMFSHGICTGGLFLVLAALENRGLTSQLSHLGGLARQMPSLAALALVLAMASLGCPGLCSFPAELAMLLGLAKASWKMAALASLGVVLAGWYGLRFYQGAWNGPSRSDDGGGAGTRLPDADELEWAALLPLAALCFAVGLFPDATILEWTKGLL